MVEQKTLIIVESPNKAKKISKFLGAEYNVQASIGHVVDLVPGGKGTIGVDIANGFKPKYAVLPDKVDKIKALTKAASQAKKILLAPDPDREGEAIAWHLAEIIAKVNDNISRITFNEITKKAVQEAINSPRDLDVALYDAQQARRVLDRIVGYSVSPYLIEVFKDKLSAGRVQSVALRMIVDREREIEAFKPEEYWNVLVSLANSKSESFIAKYIGKITNEKEANTLKTDLDKDSYIITDLVRQEQKKYPNPPFETASLAATAAGKYRFQAAKTMAAAQKLYEAGLITYMRTDSVRVSDDAVDFCRDWLKNNGYEIPDAPNTYVTSKSAQDAHEAIRPTDVNTTSDNLHLSEDETKIYKLIWERFVASQMNPAIFDTVAVTVTSSSKHELKANGKILKYKGWLEIIETKTQDVILPNLKLKEKLTLVDPGVVLEQNFTKPPARFSDKTLIEELKRKEIGRPSTFANIMSKITDRSYVTRKANVFHPSELGKKVVDELIKFFNFMEYDYTAEMERNLDKIAAGELKYIEMLTEFYGPFKIQLKGAYDSKNKDYGFNCDNCNKPMFLKHGLYGFYMACSNYPDSCKNTFSCEIVDDKPVIKHKETPFEGAKCPDCNSVMFKKDGKFGPFLSCLNYPKCKGRRKAPWGKKCPECKNELYGTIYSDEEVLFCMGFPNCKYSEKLPKGSFANPNKLTGPKPSKRVTKILKS